MREKAAEKTLRDHKKASKTVKGKNFKTIHEVSLLEGIEINKCWIRTLLFYDQMKRWSLSVSASFAGQFIFCLVSLSFSGRMLFSVKSEELSQPVVNPSEEVIVLMRFKIVTVFPII